MGVLRIAILLAVALVAVVAQNYYIDATIKALNKVQGLVNATPAFKKCIVGMPLEINPWLLMTNEERLTKIGAFNIQNRDALFAIIDEGKLSDATIIEYQNAFVALANIIIEGTKAGELTPAPPAPTTPAPTTVKPTPTTPTTPTPVPTTPAPTTPGPTTPAPTTVAPVNGTCNVIANKDRFGFDLANVQAKVVDCATACQETKGCATYTWNNHNGGTCWLKSRAGPLVDKEGVSATDCVFDVQSLVCNAYKDIDFVGMDITNQASKSHEDCCDICAKHTGCSAYSWTDYNGGTCWLKKSVGQVIAKVGVTSSSTVQLWGPVCPFEYDTDFEGMDIGNARAADAGVCCSQCKANKDCKAYTWSNYLGGTCWMKSGKGKAVATKGVISAKLVGF